MHGEYKIPQGKLVVVDLDVEAGRIVRPSLAGDFFLEPDEALSRFNAALAGLPADSSAAEITATLGRAVQPGDILHGITPEGVAVAVRRALGNAVAWEDLDFEVIHGPVVHPAVNIALDELLPARIAAGQRGPMLRMWEWDRPLLVMGSFQSYQNEVDQEGVDRHGITVSRRITGGGAMFMEPGNALSYSLYVPTALVEGLGYDQGYAFLDEWVMEALSQIGVRARYVPINDIVSEAGKIGGAAQRRFATGWMLHHVTMSYDIDATKMLEVMRIGKEKIRDKGIRSAAKRVDPMRSQTGMSREAISEVFLDHFTQKYGARRSELTAEEVAAAEELARTKFLSDEWVHRVP